MEKFIDINKLDDDFVRMYIFEKDDNEERKYCEECLVDFKVRCFSIAIVTIHFYYNITRIKKPKRYYRDLYKIEINSSNETFSEYFETPYVFKYYTLKYETFRNFKSRDEFNEYVTPYVENLVKRNYFTNERNSKFSFSHAKC